MITTNWRDAIAERAKLPQLTDLGGARIAYNDLTCSSYTEHAFRRLPIPYQILGRERRYRVDDVIAYARKQLAEAPMRKPPQRRRKLANAEATPSP